MSKIHVAITKQISETQTNLPAAGELTPPSGPKQLLHFPHTCCLLAQTSCLKKKKSKFCAAPAPSAGTPFVIQVFLCRWSAAFFPETNS